MKRIKYFIISAVLMMSAAAGLFPQAAAFAEEISAPTGTNGYALEYFNLFFEGGANRERRTGTEGAHKTAQWLAERFEKLGLEDGVVIKDSSDSPKFIRPFEIAGSTSLLQQQEAKTAYNVAGMFKCGKPGAKTVIIAANYDNLYGQSYMQGFSNKSVGALDNASGLSVMLSIARAVTESAEPDFNILFTAFGAKNDGLYGSADFITNSSKYGVSLSDIDLMINLSCVAGGDKLYLYCDEVKTQHEDLIKSVADAQPENGFALNLPPANKKIVPDNNSPLQYSHKGMDGDHLYFWYNKINTAYFFGYNWDISALGNTESAAGSIAGTDSDTPERLFSEFYKDGAAMMDSAVNIIMGVLYDGRTAGVLSGSQAEKYDYWGFIGNDLYPFIFQIVVILLLCGLFAMLYYNGLKKTPKIIIQKYTAKVAVFGDDYENEKDKASGGRGGSPPDTPPGNPFQ